MKKTLIILTLITFLFAGFNLFSANTYENFLKEYKSVLDFYQKAYSNIKSRSDYNNWKKSKNTKFKEIINKYDDLKDSNSLLLKSKLFIEIGDLKSAESIIEDLLEKKIKNKNEVKKILVKILLFKKDIKKALTIFKQIENKVKKDEDYYFEMIMFAYMYPSKDIKKEYTLKFINEKNIPEKLKKYIPTMYRNLAKIELMNDNIIKAKEFINKALQLSLNKREKQDLESMLAQIELFGKIPSEISAEKWINSKPLKLISLKGKVVIIDFWATWCEPCRSIIPVLVDLYSKYKDKGLVIIGFTRLYGMYRDEISSKGKVSKDEEIQLTMNFLKRHKISYPIAIANEDTVFNKYRISGIPTMVFINKEGKIDFIKVGAGAPDFIRSKVKKLLGIK